MPCHARTYDNEAAALRMVSEQRNMRVPAELVPRCPVCGEPMTMNLRADDTFVEDEGWHAAAHTKEAVADVEVAALRGQPRETVTPDRGKEFADHARVTREVGAEFYFCSPHHPWEKGTVENTNGLLREYFPKGTDFSLVTDGEVAEVYDAINHRPRKCLGWRTLWEVHYGQVLHLL